MIKKSVILIGLFAINSIVNANIVYSKEESSGNSFKVAIVDIQKIEEKSLISKDLKTKISNKESELHSNLMKRKDKIEKDYKEIEKNRAILSRVELEKKAKQLENDMQKLQFDEKKYGQIFEMSKIGALNNLQQEAQKIIDKVGDNYDVIIPTSVMLYYNKAKFIDITNDVLSKLNSSVKVSNYDKFYKEAEAQVNQMILSQQRKTNSSNKK